MKGLQRRFHKALYLTMTVTVLALASGCSSPQTDPSQKTIPTDSDQWQDELGQTFEQLPAADQQVLSRYMLRMKLSDAYESGAMPRTTIKQALIQQREYERLHPNNPTGKKSPIVTGETANATAQKYPVALLPIKTSDSDSLNQVKMQFMLSNHGTVPIESFKGTLTMQDDNLEQGKNFNVPLITFDPAIEPEQSGKIVIDSSIEDINVMRAIKNTTGMTIEIKEGTLVLVDDQTIEFGNSLAK
ncbi:hypothetical protein NJD71_12055 [Psychrobacter sp. PP-21]|uniref:hypothetical protein n=1 Tax=Psychrobacter sp. PP-21 TaxID=2957503 RepID=UPI0029A4F834|nr:hypothetical protein [Psychrobacter sp. PP-21]MDX2374851.1 hypothetical protein [Psychrobacter sp. PP-21]